ncbi:hypothetical protein K439DRAFT_1665891 [Ramaria rubella]|nr:hypothetical protein K439DRAFT_1665891 [Ramaria rubella]
MRPSIHASSHHPCKFSQVFLVLSVSGNDNYGSGGNTGSGQGGDRYDSSGNEGSRGIPAALLDATLVTAMDPEAIAVVVEAMAQEVMPGGNSGGNYGSGGNSGDSYG